MKKEVLILFLILLSGSKLQAQIVDAPYRQATSVKYKLSEDLIDAELIKVVVDYNDIVYLLTDKGLYRDYYEDEISKDLFYRLLAKRNPVDISVQEETGYLYYLYNNQFLTNAHAGVIYKYVDENIYHKILVNAKDQVLLLGNTTSSLFQRTEKIKDTELPEGDFVDAAVFGNTFYYLTHKGVYKFNDGQWELLHAGRNLTAMTFDQHRVILGTSDGYYSVNLYTGKPESIIENRLPVPFVTAIKAVGRELWFTSEDGAFLQEPDRYRYFAGKRWLDNNKVIDIASDSKGDVYFLTPTGLNKVKYVTQTLADKTKKIQDDIRKYHMRFGWVNEICYKVPGDLKTAESRDNDNDGLWTSLYLGSQVFRFATTGEAIAKRYVWESFESFERLLTVNPLKGFPSRTFERRGILEYGDAWRPSHEEEWDWKGTTSTDEYIAYLFIASLMNEFITETADEKARVANFIDAIMTHIIENDYFFVDYDGKPTRWGRWNPEYVNWYPKHVSDRKLNSAHLIAGLQLAYDLTGKEIYKTEAFRMMDEHGYLDNIMFPMRKMRKDTTFIHLGDVMGDEWNHSDDEMSFITYWVLVRHAFNDDLKAQYIEVTREHWEMELPEKDALWEMLTYGTSGDICVESAIWDLREFNIDLTRYSTRNSHRKDLNFMDENFRNQTTEKLLYRGEREMHRHNTNPFSLDMGGGGKNRLAGDEYLLPYWMARYFKIIL